MVSTPNLRRMFSKSCTVAPKMLREATMCSPAFMSAMQQCEDRGHAGGGGDAGFRALQRGQAFLEGGHRGIGEAGVNVPRLLVRKARRRLGGIVEHEAGGEVERFGVLVELAAVNARPHGEGLDFVVVVHVCLPPRADSPWTRAARRKREARSACA